MKVVITGAAGFLGSRVADALLKLDSPIPVKKLILVDAILPPKRNDPRVNVVAVDLTSPEAALNLVEPDCDVFFHLAAIVSGHAEADFNLGMAVNFDATRSLLEVARKKVPALKFVFTSSCGVFGGNLPKIVTDMTACHPQTSYGVQKAMCELLIQDYSRKGFLDGRFVRLPTICIRPGAANKAMTSFVSGIVREPLNGQVAICPVDREQKVWISSPSMVVKNIIHAALVPANSLGLWRGINIPGFCVSVDEILTALRKVAGEKVVSLVRFEKDAEIRRMLESLPLNFDNSHALKLGFGVDTDFTDVINSYIRDELKQK
ncbi:D-erythronate dehydrogenase-like [Plodia interpunctella]|uniref:D-erythronate dehydrogenase-like n=1 Tax=Plodia interpunctella TaxID=58824 RepID=UPI002368260C|nr:D-erythronate dehydrogenase-like [Plodia interpunctella]